MPNKVLRRSLTDMLHGREAQPSGQRLDIQGLRMVAVLAVFSFHLLGWPQGGFVGVDVFFVISGYLITGNLLRMANENGNVSFRQFYWNRVRRIVPAATIVLVITYAAASAVFLPFRAHQIGIDALWAAIFMSNWWFAARETDYFAGSAPSPIQHYWSLSIEEQFYFLWPALLFLITLVVMRKAWTQARRMWLAATVIGGVVAVSLMWALAQTAVSPTAAYFNTFARAWELGLGALLATGVGMLSRIPAAWRPVLSWAGVVVIAASMYLCSEHSVGFPAPWALVPVAGSAVVIAAGVGGEPRWQLLLRNPVSTYVGDISYSLYLVHWPVIVILGALMDRSAFYFAGVVAMSLGLAVASYHFIENPLRRMDFQKLRQTVRDLRGHRYERFRTNAYPAIAALVLIVVALGAIMMRPPAHHDATPPSSVTAATPLQGEVASPTPTVGPLGSALRDGIAAALQATAWPNLDPSMESVITRSPFAEAIAPCIQPEFPSDASLCEWGAATAPTRIVLVGDSIAATYAIPLREIALRSGGKLWMHLEALPGCRFTAEMIDPQFQQCAARKRHAVEAIKSMQPTVVMISNVYGGARVAGGDHVMSGDEWADSMQRFIDGFRSATQRVVLLAPPPSDKNVGECFSAKGSVPADCISAVPGSWWSYAGAEQRLAATLGGVWLDSLPWFCDPVGDCPAFVGTTPTKRDFTHMTQAYGEKIFPVVEESLRAEKVFSQ